MRLANRVKKLEAAAPKCGGPVLRFVREGQEYVPTDADRCRVCGGCHVQIVREVIVRTSEDVERVRALNAAEERS